MSRVKTKKGSSKHLPTMAMAIFASMALLLSSSAYSESLHQDKQDALLISPMGWAAMAFFPVGLALKSGLRAGYLVYTKDNPITAAGELVDKKATRPLLKRISEEKKEKRLLPAFELRPEVPSFISDDLARSVNIKPAE